MTRCALCPRTPPDGQRLCAVHQNDLHRWLAEIPEQAALLAEEFVMPGGRPAAGRLGGTGRATAPVPVDLRVLVLLAPGRYDDDGPDDDGTAPIAAVLGAWAGHITYHHPAVHRDEYGTAHTVPCEYAAPRKDGRTRETITGWCAWLRAYLPAAVALDLAADFYRALDTLVRRLRHLTHTTPQQHPRAAPCPACDLCTLVRTDGHWHIHCLDCGHRMSPDEYQEHAAAYLATRNLPES
ncbi:hypothetical protein ACIPEL_15285 [Streptomyces griseoviridis]